MWVSLLRAWIFGIWALSIELFKRLKYGDLNEKYRNDVLNGSDEYRDVMISIMNVICGNIEIECASAVNSLSEFVKESGKYFFIANTHVTCWSKLANNDQKRQFSGSDV